MAAEIGQERVISLSLFSFSAAFSILVFIIYLRPPRLTSPGDAAFIFCFRSRNMHLTLLHFQVQLRYFDLVFNSRTVMELLVFQVLILLLTFRYLRFHIGILSLFIELLVSKVSGEAFPVLPEANIGWLIFFLLSFRLLLTS